MNEIRNSGINNYSSISLGRVQNIAQQDASSQIGSLEVMLDKTLGAPASAGYASSESGLSLDAVMSGSLGGYLGLGDEAVASLESPIASSQILASKSSDNALGLNTVQIPSIPSSSDSKAPSDYVAVNTVQIPHIPFPEREEGMALNTVQIPSMNMPDREDGVALNTVQIPEGLAKEGGIASNTVQIPNMAMPEKQAFIPESSKEVASMLPSETLSDFSIASNINEVALGLVPGENLDMKHQSLAAISVPADMPKSADSAGAQNVAYSEIPLETLASWDLASSMPSSALAMELPDSLSAAAVADSGKPFDSRQMASVPFVEGDRKSYVSSWNNVSETLASYQGTNGQNAVGMANFLENPNGLNPEILALDTNGSSAESIGAVNRNNETLGYNSFVSDDMLGIINSSAYSSAISVNTNPTSNDSMLHPEKFISQIMYGYSFS